MPVQQLRGSARRLSGGVESFASPPLVIARCNTLAKRCFRRIKHFKLTGAALTCKIYSWPQLLQVLTQTDLPGHTACAARGKVRDIYEVGDHLLLVTTDRISAFDYILPTGIPQKGEVLNRLSLFWFDFLRERLRIICSLRMSTNIRRSCGRSPTSFEAVRSW